MFGAKTLCDALNNVAGGGNFECSGSFRTLTTTCQALGEVFLG